MFSIIACIGKNNELGKAGELVFRIREDMKFFRDTTMGHKVVMGHGTWNSLPAKLSGRENIVISRYDFEGPDMVIHDVREFIDKHINTDEEIFVIGGGMVYMEFLPFAQNLYLTEVNASDEETTVFFPSFDRTKYERKTIKNGTEGALDFTIYKYTKKEEM